MNNTEDQGEDVLGMRKEKVSNTKSVQLTDQEIIAVMKWHGRNINGYPDSESIERLRYLNKRLNDKKVETSPAPTDYTTETWKGGD